MTATLTIFWGISETIYAGNHAAAASTAPDSHALYGKFGNDHIPLKTEFGIIRVPTQVILRIRPDENSLGIIMDLANGDQISGLPESRQFTLLRKQDKLDIPYCGPDNRGIYLFRSPTGEITVYPIKKTSAQSLSEGLIVHFTFDGNNLTKIPNSTKSTPPGQLIQAKHKNGVISLDGRGDHLALANQPCFEQLNQLSLALWVKIRSFGPGGYANEHGYLVNKGKDLWWNPAWCLGFHKRTRGHRGMAQPALFTIGTEKAQGRSKCSIRSVTQLKAGVWYHLAATYDGRHAMIYVNGRLEKRIAYRGKIRRDKAPLLLGGGNLRSTKFGNHFTTDASIDNFRLYQRALSPSEVSSLYTRSAKQFVDPPKKSPPGG